MKKIVFLVFTMLITVVLAGQDVKVTSKAERKAQRKLEKEKIEKDMIVQTEKAIMSGNFVLKADQIRNKYGNMLMVNSTLNFVAVKGRDVYVQFGTESGMGYNGIGGITVKGNVVDYELTRDKKNSGYSLKLTTSGTFGFLTIYLRSNITGDIADARVQSNWGSTLIFSGDVVPITGSHIYKGSETY